MRVLFLAPLYLIKFCSGWIKVDFGDNNKDPLWYAPPTEDITFLIIDSSHWKLEGLLLLAWAA